MPAPAPVRVRVDACPGVFAPHDAADGALARVRLPGGTVSASALRAIADCAEELGDGRVHLTSRGNLQLRGLTRGPALAQRLAAAGLLPSATHERVRNVLASPLSGIASVPAASAPLGHGAGHAPCGSAVREMAAALDRALCARPVLARLPGRFLFALDDGRGDVAAEESDLCWQAGSGASAGAGARAATGVLRVAGVAVAVVDAADAVTVLLDAAEAFLALRAVDAGRAEDGTAEDGTADGGTAWRAAELAGAPARIAAALGLGDSSSASRVTLLALNASGGTLLASAERAPHAATPGLLPRDDGGVALVVAPLLGELTAAQVRLLADAACDPASGTRSDPAPDTATGADTATEAGAVVTPWRTIVLPHPRSSGAPAGSPRAAADVAARLAAAGLVVAPGPAADLSACAGRPGCARALADVRADARRALGTLPAGRVHVSGCARRCGAPRTAHLDVVARDGGGYLVDGVPRPWPVP